MHGLQNLPKSQLSKNKKKELFLCGVRIIWICQNIHQWWRWCERGVGVECDQDNVSHHELHSQHQSSSQRRTLGRREERILHRSLAPYLPYHTVKILFVNLFNKVLLVSCRRRSQMLAGLMCTWFLGERNTLTTPTHSGRSTPSLCCVNIFSC